MPLLFPQMKVYTPAGVEYTRLCELIGEKDNYHGNFQLVAHQQKRTFIDWEMKEYTIVIHPHLGIYSC